MLIKSVELPPIGTNSFMLIDEARGECLVIDAPLRAYSWAVHMAEQYKCKIVGLILTHGHWDHILDGHLFVEAGIPTYGHKADTPMFEKPSRMASYAIPGQEMNEVKIDHWIEGGQTLNLLGVEMEIRHVPGHCPGNILVYIPSEEATIVGDVIFAGSVGRYDLPGGDFDILSTSIKEQIYSLPATTTIYPGHGGKTSVGHEKQNNPSVKG